MSLWARIFVVIVLSPLLALAQSSEQQFQTESELVSALCENSETPSSRELLLKAHSQMVSTHLWSELNDRAAAAYNLLLPDQSVAIYGIAIQVARQLNQPKLLARTYYNLGKTYFGLNKLPKAIEAYEESQKYFEAAGLQRDLIYVLADLGTLHIYSSDYRKARQDSEQSIALAEQLKASNEPAGAWPDEYGVGTALSNLGNVSRWEGNYGNAISYFQKSLGLYQRIDNGTFKYSTNILDNLADIGRTYRSIGDNLQALSYLNRAMELAKASRNSERLAGIYNSIGILYSNQRDYSKAIEFFQQGLQLSAFDRFKQAELLLNIGVEYQLQGDYERALQSFVKSQESAKTIDYKEVVIAVGEGLGAIYKEQGAYKAALDALNESLVLAKQIDDKTRIAELLWRQAEVQYARGNFTQCISTGSEAARMAEHLNLRNVSYLALTTLGKAYRAEGQLDLAMQTFSKAISQIEEMRGQVAGLEQERQLFFEDKVGPYHEIVDLLLNLDKSDHKYEALVTAERAKARVLLDVMGSGRIDLAKAMSQGEKEEERRLNNAIVALNVRIMAENNKRDSDDAVLESLNEELRSARVKHGAFQDSLYASHSELRGRLGQSPALTLNDLSTLVGSQKAAFLEYMVTKSKTYLFVLTRAQGNALDLRVHSINISDKNLASRAREFREMLAGQSPTFADTARQLYDLLVKPAEDQLKDKSTVCILPDGILWDLPFQALQPKDDRYLLEDFALFYAPSLGILKEMSQRRIRSERPPPSLLAFGNPRLGNEVATNLKAVYRGEILAPLPEAEVEVKALKEIWKPAPSKIFVGPEAGKNIFKTEAEKYAVIHLATHGILDDSNPMYSRLVMARAENDPNDDGLLEAREIMQLNLHADLVVLSACQTARGRFGAGEGMVGMSWAFFVAGVPTMVASQWKVDSGSTARLMISFHKHLKNTATDGTTKASALRQAALEVLKDQRYRHPFFWAGFVMIGEAL